MSLRLPIALATVALGAAAFFLLRMSEPPPPAQAAARAPAKPAPTTTAAPPRLAASSVLAIDPRANGKGDASTPRASLHNEFLASKDYKALHDRLKSGPEGQTPEGMYVLYEMLSRCANIPDRDARFPSRRPPQKRDEFVAAIPENDPQRAKRIAAYDEVNGNRCGGLEGLTMAQADLAKLLNDAAGAGEPKARAVLLEREILSTRRAGGREATLSDTQVEALRQTLGTRDPEAILIAGRILSSTWNDFSLQIGPNSAIVEPRALMQAWQFLACDYGYPCGADNRQVLYACANQGHCDASTLQDYLFYYGGSPHDSQLVTSYRGILRNAMESGNWDELRVARGPTTRGQRFVFVPGPWR